jgi:hypothetical protein
LRRRRRRRSEIERRRFVGVPGDSAWFEGLIEFDVSGEGQYRVGKNV